MKTSNFKMASPKDARSLLGRAVVVALLPVLAQMPMAALAEETVFLSPATSYTGTFTNPDNAFSSNNVYAVAESSGISQQYGDFSVSGIPVGAGINGIIVRIEGNSTGPTQGTRKFKADLSWDGGNTFTSGTDGLKETGGNFGTSDSTAILGTNIDDWGRNWTPGEFTSTDFRIRLLSNFNQATSLRVDHIQVKVDYTPAPSDLSALAVSDSVIDLTWIDNSNNETNFLLERSIAADSGFAQIAKLDPNIEAYKDEGLACGTTYYYRVRANKSEGAFTSHTNVANATTNACVGDDLAPPTITINTPTDGASYILNDVVYADYFCVDNVAVLTCAGDVADGAQIGTDSVGSHTFTVEAEDTATPANTASLTHNYSVVFDFGGFRPPLDPTGPREFKAGSTIPVKFQLFDVDGYPVGTASGTATISTSPLASAAIRYDDTAEQYIANLKTLKGTTPGQYTITVHLNDGSDHLINVTLK